MAQKKSASAKTTVRRIKATDDTPKKTVAAKKEPSQKPSQKKVAASAEPALEPKRGILSALGGYFKGAWAELKQVRWPTRKATWGMTLAVLIFTAFFVVLIILLDTGFGWLFEQILR